MPAFERLAGDTEHCRDFLRSIEEEFGRLVKNKDGLDIHAWDDPEVCAKLEKVLGYHMDNNGISREEAFRNYRLGIERNTSLHPGLKDKLRAGIDLLQAEHDLVEAMQTNSKFQDFPRHLLWQLVVPGNHTDIHGKWELEHKVQGSYAGLCRGLTEVIETKPRQVFNGDQLGQLHEAVTSNNIRQDELRYLYGEGTFRAQMDTAREQNRVPVGYRQGFLQKELRLDDGSLTDDGRVQFVDHMDKNYQWFGASRSTDSGSCSRCRRTMVRARAETTATASSTTSSGI